jgi:hypothetical protein
MSLTTSHGMMQGGACRITCENLALERRIIADYLPVVDATSITARTRDCCIQIQQDFHGELLNSCF